MNRFLLPLTALAALTASVQAQCYEGNLGTLIGTGDDTLFGVQPMNMTFPMGASTYTSCQFNTNGAIYLTNGTTVATGTSSTGYSTSAATMVTNLRGAAGGSPRIAAYWRDLNLTTANSAGLYYNNTIPGKVVITWKNAVHYAQTTPVFTVQAQLFATGEVKLFYDNRINNTAACPIVGVSAGNAIADPGASNLLTGVSSTSQIVYQTFATLNTFAGFQFQTLSFVPNSSGGYDETAGACVQANHTSYGSGCYSRSATFYENFPANTIDLSSTSIHLTPNGAGGYTVFPGFGSNYTHTVPGLALTDDSVGTLALPTAFSYPGGSTTSLSICSNGYIWMQTNTLADFSPTNAELFSNPARLCPMWCDGVPDGATNLANVFAEVDAVNNKAYVSWVNVPIFGGVGGTMNLQTEFNLTTGEIEIRYGSISCGNVSIVGWAPGTGQSTVDIGSRDLSVLVPSSFSTQSAESRPLALSASPAPVVGTTVAYQTSNIPATAVISIAILSFVQVNPGLDLGFLGAAGCTQLVNNNAGISFLQFGGPTASTNLSIPNNPSFSGINLYGQSAALDSTQNALGVIFSNGVKTYTNGF